MSRWDYPPKPEPLIGRKVTAVWFSDDHLTFDTDQGLITYTVEGDCCSRSLFHDFVGVDKLLENGPVTEFKVIKEGEEDESAEYCTRVYGYALTTESAKWGEMTTVFSFRNESNGYYGGWLNDAIVPGLVTPQQRKLTADVVTG
jgi:hypothetical protein